MDTSTGRLYPSPDAALAAGVTTADLAEIKASEKQARFIALATAEKVMEKRKRQAESARRFLLQMQDGVARAENAWAQRKAQVTEQEDVVNDLKNNQ